MKNNRKLTYVLGVLVLGVWGTIAYQLYGSMTQSDADEMSSGRLVEPAIDRSAILYAYADDVRDPFRMTPASVPDSVRQRSKATAKPVWTPPPLKLTGIMASGKKRTAMIETGDGMVFFLHEGDTLKGVKLLKIADGTVKYKYQNKLDEWAIAKQ